MNIMNKSQADELFCRESVLIGALNCIPLSRIAELFGEGAVEHVKSLGRGNPAYVNAYSIADYMMPYATYKGFLLAVSYSNIRLICGIEK